MKPTNELILFMGLFDLMTMSTDYYGEIVDTAYSVVNNRNLYICRNEVVLLAICWNMLYNSLNRLCCCRLVHALRFYRQNRLQLNILLFDLSRIEYILTYFLSVLITEQCNVICY